MRHRWTALALLLIAGCGQRGPSGPRHEALESHGIDLTLPSDWRGGHVTGSGFIYSTAATRSSFSVSDSMTGISVDEAGVEAFLTERIELPAVERATAVTWGPFAGFEAVGDNPEDGRHYFGAFEGPNGPVFPHLVARAMSPDQADALWSSIRGSVRAHR